MSTLLKIDQKFRDLFSIIFRAILILYSILIIVNYNTYFILNSYLFIIIGYLILYFLTKKKNGVISVFRLILDFTFIFFVIYKIPLNDFLIISFLFLPILNTNNHSGNKKSILVYLIPLIYVLFVYGVYFDLKIFLVYFSFYLINLFGTIRNAYINFTETLNSYIDDFFLDINLLKRPHKIYIKVMYILNRSRLIVFETQKILCFDVSVNRITLINSSEFIWNYNFENQKDVIDNINKLGNNKSLPNINFSIDGIIQSQNICFKCIIDKRIYIYILVLKPVKKRLTNFTPFFNEIITPFFTRLSKVFETFINQKNLELDNITEIEKKISYVNNAINSMHFIRNKLSPIRNYLDMINDYNNVINDKEEIIKRDTLKKIIENERGKLSVSLDNILERANSILEKENNPFNVNELKRYSTLKLYFELRRIWELHIDDVRPYVKLNINKSLEDKNLEFNLVGIDLVFSNWINNIRKYNAGYYSAFIHDDNENVFITFENSVHNINDAKEIKDLFNSEDRIEISKRKSHGLIEIKDFLNQMNIKSNMSLESEKLILVLRIKKINL